MTATFRQGPFSPPVFSHFFSGYSGHQGKTNTSAQAVANPFHDALPIGGQARTNEEHTDNIALSVCLTSPAEV